MDDLTQFHPLSTPTAQRPLLGLTILAVEDSRFACEALRLMCLKSGARIRRADCLAAARRHLKLYRPSLAIVDIGLPDGSGLDLIHDLPNQNPGYFGTLATSGDDGWAPSALRAGAAGFLHKPIASLFEFQAMILKILPTNRRPTGPRQVSSDAVQPDQLALTDDLVLAAQKLARSGKDANFGYLSRFISGVAQSAGDRSLARAAQAIAPSSQVPRPSGEAIARLQAVLERRIAAAQPAQV